MNIYNYLFKFIIVGDTSNLLFNMKMLGKVVYYYSLLILDSEMNMMQLLELNLDQEISKLMISKLNYKFGIQYNNLNIN